MSIDRTARLKNLHLYGMAAAWSDWQAEYALQQKPVMPEVWLDRLIEAEQVDRQARSLSYQLKAARFPLHRDLMSFDWKETPLPQARIEQLATAGFMEQAYNLILVGGTGTGKTHLATALAVAAIHQGKRVRFYNAVDLVNQLDKEKHQGKAGNLAKQLSGMDAVIIDELGYLPFPAAAIPFFAQSCGSVSACVRPVFIPMISAAIADWKPMSAISNMSPTNTLTARNRGHY